jgi:hypothetical protein
MSEYKYLNIMHLVVKYRSFFCPNSEKDYMFFSSAIKD